MTEYISEFISQIVDFIISEEISNFGESVKDQISEKILEKLESNNIFKKIDKEQEVDSNYNFNELTLEILSYYYN